MSPRIGLDPESVLAAAAELADEQGFEAVTLATLAQKLSIRPPSLYNHIQGLPDLRVKLAVYGIDRLHTALEEAIQGREGDEAVFALSEAYITFARRHPGLYAASQRHHNRKETGIQLAAERTFQLVGSVLKEAYGLKGDTAIHAMRGLRSVLHGFASLEREGGFGIGLSVDESLKVITAAFIAGMRTLRRDHSLES
ncbi:TetR/AcrR family transcriptional regulator [Paenibacillus gansuensis]|uniref:WHG domain-containing protein n=1 Tax=Paenibacillus gansuensis TaxID=306542 RepID=A0ABW5PCC1_9BACL